MNRTLLLAGLALAAAGCSSPEFCDEPVVQALAAFPGLTYVDGDPEAGTTTMASLPLLTYRKTEQVGSQLRTRTCVAPLLASFEQVDRPLEVTWGGAPKDPPPEGGWWGAREKRDLTPREEKERARRARSRAAGGTDRQPAAGGQAAPPRGAAATSQREQRRPSGRMRIGPSRRVGRVTPAPRSEPAASAPLPPGATPPAGKARSGSGRLVLELDEPAEVVRSLPLQQTDVHVLFPLIHFRTERPAVALVRTRSGREAIYQAGPTRNELRLLPLFSYSDGPEASSFIFWPLFSGYERDATGSYLRLFWFIKIRLSGPDAPADDDA